jgi:hypothetical protein
VAGPIAIAARSRRIISFYGDIVVVLFDDEGQADAPCTHGRFRHEQDAVYRFAAPIWHSVIIRSQYAGIPRSPTDRSARRNASSRWAPADEARLRAFLAGSVARLSRA